jgi:homoserine kinase
MVNVRVPATTANIGPGFDSLGCALTLYAKLSFEETESGLVITGCPEEYTGHDNLAAVSYFKTLEAIGARKRGLRIDICSDIPAARGLGSSAAMIAAGAAAANRVHGDPLDKMELIKIGCGIEGHPDNLAAAVLGGFTASFMDNGIPVAVTLPISDKLGFFALIPDFEVETHKARQVLPNTVSFSDAVFNVSRVPVLIKALEKGDMELIGLSLRDRLHQPYRQNLIHDCDALRSICYDSGCAAFFISGSGPTCICLADEGFAKIISPRLAELSRHWVLISLSVDREGTVILSGGGEL